MPFPFAALNASVMSVMGEAVTLRRQGLADLPLRAVFDSRHYEVAGEDGMAAGTTRVTTVSVREADVTPGRAARQGDGVAARGTEYRIRDVRPDGQGMAVWELEKA